MTGEPALNWAAMAGGAGFANHMAPVTYKIKQDPNRTFADAYSFLATPEVAPINEATIYSVVTSTCDRREVYHHYRVSKLRAVGGHVLEYHCLNLQHSPQTSAFLIDRVDYEFHDWLSRTFDKYSTDPQREDTTWAAYIATPLLGIISGVASGLVSLFKAKHYHGNLLAGVALKIVNHTPVGYIYNMRLITDRSPSELRTRDIHSLLSLINVSVDFGYSDNVAKRNDVAVLSKAKTPVFAFQSRVNELLLSGSGVSHTWILNDPHFWTFEDKSEYMKKLFKCLYVYRIYRPKHLISAFDNDWYTIFFEGDGLLEEVYKYGKKQDSNAYLHGASLVRFWRNALEHLNEQLFVLDSKAKSVLDSKAKSVLDSKAKYLEDSEIVARLEARHPIATYCHQAIEQHFVTPLDVTNTPPIDFFNMFRSKMGFLHN